MAAENYGPGVYGPYFNAGVPVAGTNAVQTLTIGGTPTGGTFNPNLEGIPLGPITWVNVNATLLAALNAASDAKFGASQIVWTAGTLTAGVGTILATFSGSNFARRVISTMTVTNNLTGTSPTVTVATTTPGVTQTLRNVQPGSIMIDTTNYQMYQAGGTLGALTWGKVGAQV